MGVAKLPGCDKCGAEDVPLFDWGGDHPCGLCFARGYGTRARWCQRCITARQLEYAKEWASRVPGLQWELAKLTGSDT